MVVEGTGGGGVGCEEGVETGDEAVGFLGVVSGV